ncbi:unnamed protein product [Candidula unifasciata]|uniref:Uncharacterized protein n=1 Tax=Candidula unifasciata TaxID=100452 RepID=A0A8S3YBW8_9EUPU|nr:unnamed protein product [Candidula unifasciata]
MAQGQLTNGQYFRKHRFAELCPPSDFQVVCHGKLIKSSRQPETFYNGWYPVRHRCSFPDHEAVPGAGLKSEKGLQFRNYRILCDICDHPDNKLVLDKEKSCWSQLASCRNSVAPRMCEQDVSSPAALPDVEMERAKRCSHKVDAYWRYHDPHYVASAAGLPNESRVHDSNWFSKLLWQTPCLLKQPESQQTVSAETNHSDMGHGVDQQTWQADTFNKQQLIDKI